MNKKLTATLTLIVLLLTTLPVHAAAPLTTTLANNMDGSLVRAKWSRTQIFYVSEGHKMRVPEKAFTTGVFDKNDVTIIPYKELVKIPRAKYVSAEESNAVYSLSASGQRAFVGNESTVSPAIQAAVVEIPQQQLDVYALIAHPLSQTPFALDAGKSIEVLQTQEMQYNSEFAHLNNLGQVAFGKWFWDGKQMHEIPGYDGYSVQIMDLNNKGQMIGYMKDDIGEENLPKHSFFWDTKSFVMLNDVRTDESLLGITDEGTIYGYREYNLTAESQIFTIKNGVKKYSEKIGYYTVFFAVNNNGAVLGNKLPKVRDPNGPEIDEPSRLFIWKDGTITYIPFPEGYKNFYAGGFAINDKEMVTATHGDPQKSGIFLYSNGASNVLSGVDARPRAINNNGDVVGTRAQQNSDTGVNEPVSTIWRDGKSFDLSKVLSFKSEWGKVSQIRVLDINDNGQVLIQGLKQLIIFQLPTIL